MHEALTGLLEKSELALSATRDLVEREELDRYARLVADARLRLDYPDDLLVVALAGGTGSGKSSLFNALTGLEAAPVGDLRPTTAEPLAAVPNRHPGAFDGYLDHLGIGHRVEQPDSPVCLIDLPDTDSVEVAHRHRVEEILPLIDVVVWVVDPEKYRDAALHHRYLRPLAPYSSQFVFALNQVDRVDPESLDQIVGDLRLALVEGGITDPAVFVTSMSPLGPPAGVDALGDHLRGLTARREVLYDKLLGDLASAASAMADLIGPPIGYRDRLEPVLEEAAGLLASDDGDGAVAVLTRFCERLAGEVGGLTGRRVITTAADFPAQVNQALVSLPSPSTRRWWARRQADKEEFDIRHREASQTLIEMLNPVGSLMAERARALAAVTDLSIRVSQLRVRRPG